jgi:nitrogen fixation/metabolism regulation signal transduction histidine kinase
MKLYKKLTSIFVIIFLLAGFVGITGIYTNKQTVINFEGGEKQFGSIIMASAEISSYAKRAEGHVMLYITLCNEQDKQKFLERIKSLRNQTFIIDENVKNPEARNILEEIKSKTDELQSIGESLMEAQDNETKATGDFMPKNHEESIRSLNEAASKIREDGVKLAELETRLKTEQEEAAKKNASFFYSIIFIISAITMITTLILGYAIAKNIIRPIIKLNEAVIDISKGNLNTKIDIKSTDEIDDLAVSFKDMIAKLSKSKSEVLKSTKELENSKRELEIKIKELEKFNKVTIGRELEMVKLKKEIEKLKGDKK